ncbi:uncharacterized protein LOC114312403 [Camellia sinensis]|uniref:uncharacterized protein LOC114312403 n=1 Tax=Camellia sinensis TaxID=4442 RepID=UPI001036E53D|nr:uncharacterized protein LOC114312403 [Camellia sinensis]
MEWKRNLTIVLTAEKLNYVLTTDPPMLLEADATDEQHEDTGKWHEADDVAKCYILASMTNVLQKQHEGVPTAKDIMVNLKEMFGEQSRSARQIAMKGLMSTKMVEDIDGETKIDAILSSLPDSYNQFILNYNMNKMIVTPLELLNMLQVAEDLIKKSQPTVMMGEKESPRKFKPKGKNNFNKESIGSKFSRKTQGVFKKGIDKKESKGNCFHCGKLGHWKRNYRYYLATLKKNKPSEGVQGDQKA